MHPCCTLSVVAVLSSMAVLPSTAQTPSGPNRIYACLGLGAAGLLFNVTIGSPPQCGRNTRLISWVASEQDPAKRLVFVTSTSHAATDLGGFGGADVICNLRASEAGLSGTYVAWLSYADGTPNLNQVAKHRVPDNAWYKVTDEIVAYSRADLLDGVLQSAIDRDERGELREVEVWTGTTSNGEFSDSGCGGWSPGGSEATFGDSTDAGPGWTDSGVGRPCSTERSLYCFQQ
jgi:hypothetical protein